MDEQTQKLEQRVDKSNQELKSIFKKLETEVKDSIANARQAEEETQAVDSD